MSTTIFGNKLLPIRYTFTDKLPEVGRKREIYLVKRENVTDPRNQYEEYIWAGGRYELLGAISNVNDIDLSNYYTKEEVDNKYLLIIEKLKELIKEYSDDRYVTREEFGYLSKILDVIIGEDYDPDYINQMLDKIIGIEDPNDLNKIVDEIMGINNTTT